MDAETDDGQGAIEEIPLDDQPIDDENNDDNRRIKELPDDETQITKSDKPAEEENTKRSRWMQLLPQNIKDLPLHYLFIPGVTK